MARMAKRKITRTAAYKKKKKKVILTDQQRAKRRAEDAALGSQLSKIKRHIVIAAGLPPHDLENDDLESVKNWVRKLKSTEVNHSVQSCQFWVKYFYDPFLEKEKWLAVRKLILDNHEMLGLVNLPHKQYNKQGSTES